MLAIGHNSRKQREQKKTGIRYNKQSKRQRMYRYLEQWNSFSEKEQIERWKTLSNSLRAEMLVALDKIQQEFIIEHLSASALQFVLRECDPDDLVDIIQRVRKKTQEKLWSALPKKRKTEIRALLQYEQTDAAGVMTSRYIAVQSDLTIRAAIEHLRKTGDQAETVYYIYVVDRTNKLQGVVSLRDMLMAKNTQLISDIMEKDVISVYSTTDQEDAAKLLSRYDLIALPVCNNDNQLLGIITFDDVIDVFRAEQTEDVYKMNAVNASTGQYLNTTPRTLIIKRVPWLLFLLLFGTITTNIISGFDSIILMSAFVVWFIPVITQTGGNSGTQSATLMIRGIAMGEVHWHNVWRVIGKELIVGCTMGIILGAALLVRGLLFPPQVAFSSALSIALALAVVVLISSLIGALFPLVIYRCGLDPTVMAGPLMATVIDTVGITLYLFIAQLFLG